MMDYVNRKGQLHIVLLLLVTLALCAAALFIFLSFNRNYVDDSTQRLNMMLEVSFNKQYVLRIIEISAKNSIIGVEADKSKDLSLEFRRDISNHNSLIDGVSLFFARMNNGDFVFANKGNYELSINNVMVYASRGVNNVRSYFDVKMVFNKQGDVLSKSITPLNSADIKNNLVRGLGSENNFYAQQTDSIKSSDEAPIEVVDIGNSLSFSFNGEEHSLSFLGVYSGNQDMALFSIKSKEIVVKMEIGAEASVDLDGDGIFDMRLKLVNINERNEALVQRTWLNRESQESSFIYYDVTGYFSPSVDFYTKQDCCGEFITHVIPDADYEVSDFIFTKWSKNLLTFFIDDSCPDKEKQYINAALSFLANNTHLTFKGVLSSGKEDISFYCKKDIVIREGFSGRNSLSFDPNNNWAIVHADIEFDSKWESYGATEMHEILHTFNFDHVENENSIMVGGGKLMNVVSGNKAEGKVRVAVGQDIIDSLNKDYS